MEIKYKWYEKFWFNWLAVTIIYLSLIFSFDILGHSEMVKEISFFFGLFVPFGIFNFLVLISFSNLFKSLFVLVLFVLSLIFVDKLLKKFKLKVGKILINLFILIILTLAVDIIFWGAPCSWLLFFSSDCSGISAIN